MIKSDTFDPQLKLTNTLLSKKDQDYIIELRQLHNKYVIF